MKEQEKQIKEMAKDFKCCYPCEMFNGYEANGELHNCNCEAYNKSENCAIALTVAKCLLANGWRKLPEDSVVLSMEEYEKLAQSFAKELLLQTERTTKEVVEKFISEIEFHGIATMDGVGLEYFKISSLGLREIAREQFDVEVDK